MPTVISTATIVCQEGAFMRWESSLLVKLIRTSWVRRLELLAIKALDGVDRLFIGRGIEDCEIIKAKVSSYLARTRHLLGRK
jgi:hypothetical protein